MRFLLPTALSLTVALTASVALAQSPALDPGLTDDDAHDLADYFDGRNQCLDGYQFGSVTFDLPDSATQRVAAGQTLITSGTVQNTNNYPLPEGRVYVHVLRQDQTVAPENWHPLVYEGEVPGDFALQANESKSFQFSWQVPQQAPAGTYRAEFFYLAGSRFVMAGLPYTPAVSGHSILFGVTQASAPGYIEFDRSSVTLQNSSLELRAVPPTLAANSPITVSVDLVNTSSTATTANVTASLYKWSVTDNQAPVLETTSQVNLAARGTTAVPFTWDTPEAGAYELVLVATPADATALPTRLKFRLPVTGNSPRIMFAGITGDEGSDVIVTTCAVNAAFGEGQGTLSTTVQDVGGGALGSTEAATEATALAASTVRIPKESLVGGIQIATQATDSNGTITDQHNVTYAPSLLETYLPAVASAPVDDRFQLSTAAIIFIGIVILLILIGLGAYAWQKRKAQPPPDQSLNPPPTNTTNTL